jgi:hypothetical protein
MSSSKSYEEVIEVNVCLVQKVFNILVLGGLDVTKVIDDFYQRFDDTKAKKVSLIAKLMLKSDTWVTKDAQLQAEVVGYIFWLYNQFKDDVKKGLTIMCESLTDEAQEGSLEEGIYLECMDNLKILHNMFDGLKNLTHAPIGEWATIDDKVILLIYY